MENMRKIFEEAIKKILIDKKYDESKKDALLARLAEMRNYAVERHDYYEKYRVLYLNIGLALIAASATLGGLLVSIFNKVGMKHPCFFILAVFSFMVTGIILVWRYVNETTPDYPYRGIAKIRSWFYVYNVDKSLGVKTKLKTEEEQRKAKETYCNNLKKYVDDFFDIYKEKDNTIIEDIEQVFILFILQGYKRNFTQKMAAVLKWGLTIACILFALGIISALWPNGGQDTAHIDLERMTYYFK